MKAFLLAVALSLISLTSFADGFWYNISGISKHTNTSVNHNERNWGFGIEGQYCHIVICGASKPWYDLNWQIGSYKNSYYRQSTYIFAELTNYRFSDTLRFRINGGLITGYRYAVEPMAIPVWTYEQQNWGLDVLTIPSIAHREGIYGLQLKLKF